MFGANISSSSSLRQKAVNLFYLIFLILIFSFIPSGFVDSTFHTNTSLELISKEVNDLNNSSTKYFLHLLKSEPELLYETKDKLFHIENITNQTTNYIDDLKLKMIEVNKMDDFGYFKFGKDENTSNQVMIRQKYADSLFNKLAAYKKLMSLYLLPSEVEEMDDILPLHKYEQSSNGNLTAASEFYFGRTPLTVSILNLSHFKSRVERLKAFTNKILFKKILKENASALNLENYKIAPNENIIDVIGNSSVQQFFEKLQPQGYLESEKIRQTRLETNYYVESLSDSIHPIGKAVRYYAHFDPKNRNKLTVNVETDGSQESFTLSKSGSFLYFPNSKGRYTFTFSNTAKTTIKRITVIDADPIIQNTRLSTLYVGLDNPLNIKTSEFDENDDLEAEITDGQIIKKGEIFYARVFKKGITKVKIFAQMPYGRIKIAEKSFVIRLLHKPIPSVNGISSGGIVKKQNLGQLKQINLQTDEYLVNEDVYVADFELLVVYQNRMAELKNLKNRGSSFNNIVLEALKNAKVGDILIFNKIRTLSSRGVEHILPSLTITVI